MNLIERRKRQTCRLVAAYLGAGLSSSVTFLVGHAIVSDCTSQSALPYVFTSWITVGTLFIPVAYRMGMRDALGCDPEQLDTIAPGMSEAQRARLSEGPR